MGVFHSLNCKLFHSSSPNTCERCTHTFNILPTSRNIEFYHVGQSLIRFLPLNDTNISVILVDLLTFAAKAFAFCIALCAYLILLNSITTSCNVCEKQLIWQKPFHVRRDTFVALPTGYGKSIIYAILPTLFSKI